MSAEMTDPEFIRVLLAELPVATAIATPPGVVAITRDAVVNAGLDSLAVTRWLQQFGGYGAVAYLRPIAHRLGNEPCRPALHPVTYFAVPLTALQLPAQAADDADAPPADAAVA